MEREYVGIDLHRRRSVIIRKNAAGELLSKVHIDNDPMAMAAAVAAAGPEPEVVLEATFGWYWAADLLADMGCRVHLAHPLGNNWGNRRVKNDERDAADLVDLLRLGRLAEAWIAPPEIRELRAWSATGSSCPPRAGLKAQVHAVMGKHGVLPVRTDRGPSGTAQLDGLDLPMGYSFMLRDLIAIYDKEIVALDRRIAIWPATPATRRSRSSTGSARVLPCSWLRSAMSVVSRPRTACALGLGSPHGIVRHQGATRVDHQEGSRLLRWAAVEAVARNHGSGKIKTDYRRISERRGRVARVAAARKLLTLSSTAYATARSDASPRSRQGDSSDAASRTARGSACPLAGRLYVIERCWPRRIAPCSDPTRRGPAKT